MATRHMMCQGCDGQGNAFVERAYLNSKTNKIESETVPQTCGYCKGTGWLAFSREATGEPPTGDTSDPDSKH